MDDVSKDTLLYYLHTRFVVFSNKYPRRFLRNFMGFIVFALKDPGQLRLIVNHVDSISEERRELYDADLKTLQRAIYKHADETNFDSLSYEFE